MSEMAATDYRSRGKKAEGGFRLAWPFKADAPAHIQAIIASELEQGIDGGVIVHACSGSSPKLHPLEVRVDLHHPSADYKADVQQLDLIIQGAAIVVIDPPYGGDVATKQRILAACLRSLRPGGLLVLHAPWWPRFKGASLEKGAIYGPFFREDNSIGWPHPPVILSCWRKAFKCACNQNETLLGHATGCPALGNKVEP